MTGRKIYTLFLVHLYCFMLLIYAWIKDAHLLLAVKRGPHSVPPWLILGIVVISFILAAKASKAGVAIVTILLLMMGFAILKGTMRSLSIDPLQYHVIISLVVICLYGWGQVVDQCLNKRD